MVDDERMEARLAPGEEPELKRVRFRTLGCYPLSGAIESEARPRSPKIIQEMPRLTCPIERAGPAMIDHDESASMEKKKVEGYF